MATDSISRPTDATRADYNSPPVAEMYERFLAMLVVAQSRDAIRANVIRRAQGIETALAFLEECHVAIPDATSDDAPSDEPETKPEQPLFSFMRQSDDEPAGKYILLRASSERFSTDPSIGDYIFAVAAIGEAMEACEAHSDVVMGLAGALKVIGTGLADALGRVDFDDQKKIAAALAGEQ